MKPQIVASNFRNIFPEDRFLASKEEIQVYKSNTIGCEREIRAVVKPISLEEVIKTVRIAQEFLIHLYPISRGNNWGYGSSNPISDNNVIVDLSLMNNIIEMDDELGVVTLEPGVTHAQLTKYLLNRNLKYMVPVHGGGPNCSLIGNALERGYGITPFTDHFSSVLSLEAVLPNSKVYKGRLSELGGELIDKLFKWGVGPYLDGLFSQGNFGIVTKMSLSLAPRPDTIKAFMFSAKKYELLEDLVLEVREILKTFGSNVSSINLMNDYRMLSMIESFPKQYHAEGIIPQSTVDSMIMKHKFGAWTGLGSMYGHKKVVDAVSGVIKQRLKPHVDRLIFFDDNLLRRIRWISQFAPKTLKQIILSKISIFNNTLDILKGIPNEVALPLAYWRSGNQPMSDKNPARDGCGLIWYTPLVPMKADLVKQFVEFIKNICTYYRFNPLITLTSLSDKCFDSTVPILFDRYNEKDKNRAIVCYETLFKEGKKLGFIPYRANIDHMDLLDDLSKPYWEFTCNLKKAVDPNNLISPGRYVNIC